MSRSESAAPRYTTTAIALHWSIAVLVVGQFAWGWWMQEIPKQPVGQRVDAFNLHKSCGLLILALMLFRLGWRIGHPAPALPAMPRWQATLANATHVTLYVALIAMPVSGYLGSVFSGYPVKFFGVTLPSWAPKSEPIKDAHERDSPDGELDTRGGDAAAPRRRCEARLRRRRSAGADGHRSAGADSST